jgi:hypothetical protein
MYSITFNKTIYQRNGIFKHLILNGFYIRLGYYVISLWKN